MIRNMKEKGMSIKSIVRELRIWRNSVRKYIKTEQKRNMIGAGNQNLIRSLIDDRNLSAVRILEEIRKTGYNGGYTTLMDYCHELREDRRIQAV